MCMAAILQRAGAPASGGGAITMATMLPEGVLSRCECSRLDPMIRVRALAMMALALVMPLAAPAQPAMPDWRDRLPGLPLDGPIAPLEAPWAIGGRAWAGFTRLCTEDSILRPDGGETPAADRRCLSIAATEEGNAALLVLRMEGLSPGATLRLRRDAEGAVRGLAVEPDPGLTATPERQRMLLDAYVQVLTTLTVTPRRLAQGDRFVPPPPRDLVPDAARPPEYDLACTTGGRAAYRGRSVLVADCAGSFEGELLPGSGARMEILMRVALEEASGLIALQSGITRTVMLSRRNGRWQEDGTMVTLRRVRFE